MNVKKWTFNINDGFKRKTVRDNAMFVHVSAGSDYKDPLDKAYTGLFSNKKVPGLKKLAKNAKRIYKNAV